MDSVLFDKLSASNRLSDFAVQEFTILSMLKSDLNLLSKVKF